MNFRVATYNVHKCKGVDLRTAPSRVAEVVASLNAEIIAAQEILASQAAEISHQTGMPFSFGGARQHAGEPYGNAVFSSLPIESVESYDLSVNRREPRQCLRVSLALPVAARLHFFAVHLGTSFLERRSQARQLFSPRILEQPAFDCHRIVAGDFNEWVPGLATQLLKSRMKSADLRLHLQRRTTYPGLLPFLHLDHIYYDPCFKLHSMCLQRTKLSLVASDHLPLIASFSASKIPGFTIS
jgi:endonuclease/exonuclease/phosphatase family metal-dependent hydrolase